MKLYTVESGDWLSKIAPKLGVTVEDLIEWNTEYYPSLATDPGSLEVGWELAYVDPEEVSAAFVPITSEKPVSYEEALVAFNVDASPRESSEQEELAYQEALTAFNVPGLPEGYTSPSAVAEVHATASTSATSAPAPHSTGVTTAVVPVKTPQATPAPLTFAGMNPKTLMIAVAIAAAAAYFFSEKKS